VAGIQARAQVHSHRSARLPSEVTHQWLILLGRILSRDTALTVSGEALDSHQLPV
jgi:hypothetical protein